MESFQSVVEENVFEGAEVPLAIRADAVTKSNVMPEVAETCRKVMLSWVQRESAVTQPGGCGVDAAVACFRRSHSPMLLRFRGV